MVLDAAGAGVVVGGAGVGVETGGAGVVTGVAGVVTGGAGVGSSSAPGWGPGLPPGVPAWPPDESLGGGEDGWAEEGGGVVPDVLFGLLPDGERVSGWRPGSGSGSGAAARWGRSGWWCGRSGRPWR